MPRAARDTVPTSVILTKDQKAFIRRVAEKENRTFSHQLRAIVDMWVTANRLKKEYRNGKESEKGGEEGPKGQEVDA